MSIRNQAAVAGIGQTTYYKRGYAQDSEFVLALQAILAACEDAGLDPREIDGFSSYSNDRNDAMRLATALDLPRVRYANMVFGGGGGGTAAAVQNAVAAVTAGYANYVVVYRSLAQGQFQRFGQAGGYGGRTGGLMAFNAPYGLMSPAQVIALGTRRFMHEHGIGQDALGAIAVAANRHAQHNPAAVMHNRPITMEDYHNSRWIVEPFHLFDCCLENDGAAALIVTSAERARDLRQPPANVLAAAQGQTRRHTLFTFNAPDYPTANFNTIAPDLWAQAGVGPKDIDVLQSYENFTGGVMMSIVEHGFCDPEEVNDFFTVENFSAPGGGLPLNTSGGNLAECYMHGLGLVVEAVRQIRGSSTCQVPGAQLSMMTSGPVAAPASSIIFSR